MEIIGTLPISEFTEVYEETIEDAMYQYMCSALDV